MSAVFLGDRSVAAPAQKSRQRKWLAFSSALVLEALVIGIVIGWALAPQTKLTTQVVALTLEAIALPTPPAPQPPEKVPQEAPATTFRAKTSVPMPVHTAAAPVTSPTPEATPAPLPVDAPSTAPVAAAAATSAPAPAAAGASVDVATAYNAKIAAAVQAAFQIPAAASTLSFKGRTRVEFSLREGNAQGIRIAHTSGFGAVDRAALQAVQSAIYPAPPAALATKEGTYQIWVACY